MSRLTRYKKAPAIKLPRALPKETSVPPGCSDGEDDDDFQAPRSVPVKGASQPQPPKVKEKIAKAKSKAKVYTTRTKSRDTINEDSETCNTTNTSKSEYFMTTDKLVKVNMSSESQKADSNRGVVTEIKNEEPIQEFKDEKEEIENFDNNEDVVVVAPDNSTKGVCPFCWKQLSDKLLGTTHVKACAKNLPTNQVLDAMELQDKQIKEWENLGIAYPGFAGASTAITGASSRKGRAGVLNKAPRAPRKKKQDPALELAMALSASLHEEVEKRKTKEKEFMITNGLSHEIEMKNEPTVVAEKFQISKTIQEMASKVSSRKPKRGKKINIMDLPLYKVSESERKSDTERRLSRILDDNMTLEQVNEFNVRDPVPINSLKLSTKLETYINKSSSLWDLSSNETTGKQEFTTKAVLECNARNKKEEERRQAASLKIDPKNVTKSTDDERSQTRVEIVENLICDEKVEKPRRVVVNLSDSESKLKTSVKTSLQITSKEKVFQQGGFRSESNEKRAVVVQPDKCGLPKVVGDILKLFLSKQDTDLVVYGREEKPIKCHRLIVKARCPKLLKDTVTETSPTSGKKREMISLTSFSHTAVKAFVHFIYCGQYNELSGHDLEDIQELSLKYKLSLVSEVSVTPDSRPFTKVLDVETQTDSVLHKKISDVKSASISVEPKINDGAARRSLDMFDSQPETIPKQPGSCVDNGYDVGVGLSGDEDLFRDINEGSFTTIVARKSPYPGERSVEVQRRQTLNHLAEGESPTDPVHYKRDEREVSPDLFGDDFEDQYEEDVQKDYEEVPDGNVFEENMGGSVDSGDNTPRNLDGDGILDDEIFTQLGPQILLSPKPHSKRARSMSPSFNFANKSGQYTATQMAVYLDLKEQRLIPDSPSSQQAKKKHKLSLDVDPNIVDNVNGNDSIILLDIVEKSVSYGTCSTSSNFKELRKDTFGTIDSEKSSNLSLVAIGKPSSQQSPCPSYSVFSNYINQNTALSTTPLPVPLLGRTLVQNSYSVSPILPQQSLEVNDPFLDDSCFANIPSQILGVPNDSPLLTCRTEKNLPPFKSVLSTTPILSQANSKRSKAKAGRQLKEVVVDSNVNVDKNPQQKKSGRNNPRNASVSQPPKPSSSNQLQPKTPPTMNQRGCQTPMLNYSAIDTPVLKQELKRYGLKPLPRTKAKLILRHIYAETHK